MKLPELSRAEKIPYNKSPPLDEEKEIIKRYRELSDSEKKAILASENSFLAWIKSAIGWVWHRIAEVFSYEIETTGREIIVGIFNYLRQQFFAS